MPISVPCNILENTFYFLHYSRQCSRAQNNSKEARYLVVLKISKLSWGKYPSYTHSMHAWQHRVFKAENYRPEFFAHARVDKCSLCSLAFWRAPAFQCNETFGAYLIFVLFLCYHCIHSSCSSTNGGEARNVRLDCKGIIVVSRAILAYQHTPRRLWYAIFHILVTRKNLCGVKAYGY